MRRSRRVRIVKQSERSAEGFTPLRRSSVLRPPLPILPFVVQTWPSRSSATIRIQVFRGKLIASIRCNCCVNCWVGEKWMKKERSPVECSKWDTLAGSHQKPHLLFSTANDRTCHRLPSMPLVRIQQGPSVKGQNLVFGILTAQRKLSAVYTARERG